MNISVALYTPGLAMNLLSVPAIVQKNAKVLFDASGCRILRGEKTVAFGVLKQGLYHLKQPEEVVFAASGHHNKDCKHVWHRRFGHRDPAAIARMEVDNLASGLRVFDCGVVEPCQSCLKGKSSRKPFPTESTTSTTATVDLVHTDVCGPVEVPSVGGYRYFMTVIDDYSRFCVLYLLRNKAEVAEKIVEYVALVKNLFGRKPKAVRSDQGGEYTGEKLRNFYKQEGIQAQFTAGYSPQQNGVAERKNRYLTEMVRCLLFDANLPQCYWAEALNTAVYLQNLLPTKAVKSSPFEMWHGTKPDVAQLKVFGCKAWVHVPKEKRKKLNETARELTFVGYSLEHKAYRFLDRTTKKVIVSRDVRFVECASAEVGHQKGDAKPITVPSQEEIVVFDSVLNKNVPKPDEPALGRERASDAEPECLSDGDNPVELDAEEEDASFRSAQSDEEELDGFSDGTPTRGIENANKTDGTPLRRSDRSTKGIPPERYQNATNVTKHTDSEPRSYQEAIQGPEKDAWLAAMKEEITSLQENQTWELVQLPPGRKLVGCKWTFKKKEDESGRVVRFKARLVAQGFSQRYGTDYDEVFAPVVKQTTFRILLTIAARDGMMVEHLDIKCAYLYADLKESIFMRQPAGFQSDGDLVCRLKRSLYGLKQSARVWNAKIDGIFKQMGFQPGAADTCLYVKKVENRMSFIVIYVDDMVVFCHSEKEFNRIRTTLEGQFKLSTLGDLRQFLGIHIEKVDGHYTLNQRSYIEKLLGRFGCEDAKPSKIPLDPGYVKQKEETNLPTNTSYRSLVGSLLYVAVNSRPDICIGTSLLSRKVSNPTDRDWTEAKRTLKYLIGTKNFRLHLGDGDEGLECFVDADWAGNEGDRKSNSGLVIKYGSGVVSWSTRKQTCVALSSTEAEFVALAEGCQELLWVKKLLNDLSEDNLDSVVVWEDNQSCIKMVESDRVERRSKHIDTKYAFTKDLHQRGVIDLRYLPTNEMVADVMTKPLDRTKLEQHRDTLGVK